MVAKLITFPNHNIGDVTRGLRTLADAIDAGEFGAAHSCAYVIDCGDADIAVGHLGHCPEPAPSAHFLLALGMRKLEDI